MKQTVLHQKHLQSKAKMTEFQGWQVPQVFTDVQDEYHAVRQAAGLFDVSFLGRIEIAGVAAHPLLQNLFTRNIDRMADRTAHYGFFCNEQGGILDDAVLFRLADDRFLLSVNAVNTDKMLAWLQAHATGDVTIADATRSLAQFSLQGPQSAAVIERLFEHAKKFKPRTTKEMPFLDREVLVSRSGYSGEHGYEFIAPADMAEQLWDSILEAGSELSVLPCGAASREMVRVEIGFLLYGNDIDESRNPFEAGQDCFVDLKKEFIGKKALLEAKAAGVEKRFAGFVLTDKSIPRAGGSIFSENREIGVVTSGTVSPALRKGIGLGYVLDRYAQPGQEIEIEVRDREIAARIVELPFLKNKVKTCVKH